MNGYIKAGHYSKREMQKLKAELIERYLPSLEYLVKRYLKACMARQFGPLPKGYYDG